MVIGNVGVGAFHSPGKVRTDKEVKNSVDAVRGDASALRLRDRFGHVVGAGGLVETRERIEHRRSHSGPLLALLGQPLTRSGPQRVSLVELVIVTRHKS
jgi:hypothetical protein